MNPVPAAPPSNAPHFRLTPHIAGPSTRFNWHKLMWGDSDDKIFQFCCLQILEKSGLIELSGRGETCKTILCYNMARVLSMAGMSVGYVCRKFHFNLDRSLGLQAYSRLRFAEASYYDQVEDFITTELHRRDVIFVDDHGALPLMSTELSADDYWSHLEILEKTGKSIEQESMDYRRIFNRAAKLRFERVYDLFFRAKLASKVIILVMNPTLPHLPLKKQFPWSWSNYPEVTAASCATMQTQAVMWDLPGEREFRFRLCYQDDEGVRRYGSVSLDRNARVLW